MEREGGSEGGRWRGRERDRGGGVFLVLEA